MTHRHDGASERDEHLRYEQRSPSITAVLVALMVVVALGYGVLAVVRGPRIELLWPGLAFIALLGAVLPATLGHVLQVYDDRIERRRRLLRTRTIRFSEIRRAQVREEVYGPRLVLELSDGRKFSKDCRGKGVRAYGEPGIKAIHDALVDCGVEVDSLNWARTGPFAAWVHTRPEEGFVREP